MLIYHMLSGLEESIQLTGAVNKRLTYNEYETERGSTMYKHHPHSVVLPVGNLIR